jgi:hypothetical protein
MRHINIFEAEVVKSFRDWLRDPKKPIEDNGWVETEYIYSCPIIKELTLADNGDFTTIELLDYIKDIHGQDLLATIARDNNMTKDQLKRDDDLDDKFDNFLKGEYTSSNYWTKFLDEYFVIEEYVDSDIDYDPIISALNELDTTFDNDDASFRIKGIEFVYPQDLRNINTNESINIYFRVLTSRPLRDKEEHEYVVEYVSGIASDLEFELNSNHPSINENGGHRLKFYVEYILTARDRIHQIRDWNVRLVQTRTLQP